MTLEERIKSDFILAYKEKNMDKKNFLGVLKGEIENMKGKGIEVNSDSVLAVVKKMEKSLKMTNDEQAKKELTFLEPYLPKLLSEEEIRNIISKNDMKSIKEIMQFFNTHHKGLVDNSLVARIAREG